MSKKAILITFFAVLVLLLVGGVFFLHRSSASREQATSVSMQNNPPLINTDIAISEEEVTAKQRREEMQTELDELTEKMVTEMRAEERLSLSMVPQLRALRDSLHLVQGYAQKVERDIELIEEITKTEFQENVRLQAALFKGKKPEIVAKHLEEFDAGRVGAILAQMKPVDAGDVLDVWAGDPKPKVRKFYRQVVAAYLSNKRLDLNPEFYEKISKELQPIEETR